LRHGNQHWRCPGRPPWRQHQRGSTMADRPRLQQRATISICANDLIRIRSLGAIDKLQCNAQRVAASSPREATRALSPRCTGGGFGKIYILQMAYEHALYLSLDRPEASAKASGAVLQEAKVRMCFVLTDYHWRATVMSCKPDTFKEHSLRRNYIGDDRHRPGAGSPTSGRYRHCVRCVCRW